MQETDVGAEAKLTLEPILEIWQAFSVSAWLYPRAISDGANLEDKKKLKRKILAMLFPFYDITQVGISKGSMDIAMSHQRLKSS